MKLSEILSKYSICDEYEIINDNDFKALGLAGSIIAQKCTFIDNERFIDDITDSTTMVFTTKTLKDMILAKNIGVCIVENPRNTFFKLHNCLAKNDPQYKRKSKKTIIGSNCKIHATAIIADMNVEIGNNVTIEEFVVIRENTTIGDNVIIRSGVKIGGSDFEFKRDGDIIFGVEHIGGVVIGNDVEIQYNSGINKAIYPWDDTIIGNYSKIDMLVHIAHGVKIGKCCEIVANSGIGGRTIIGDNCWIGFASTIRNGLKIGSDARVNMGAVVTKDVEPGEAVSGNFAIRHDKFIKLMKKNNE